MVDARNNGSIDAMIDTITNKLNGTEISTTNPLPAYLNYTVTYSDDVAIASNHLLAAHSIETYKVRVEYKTEINPSDLPSSSTTLIFTFGVTYVQADGNAVPVFHPNSFSTDSWETIVGAVQSGNTSKYHVGDTKTVQLGNSLGTHTLRIANKSTPTECGTEGFSQTACGFVLEFADIITTHRMNPYTSGNSNLDGSTVNGTGNKGGWEYSDMRAYLNSTTYANESIDYSTTGIYSSLPEVLRNAIINTTVVSGHGSVDTTNYTTTDKLYLLSKREVWNYTGSDDTAQGQTRQLDYYESIGNYSGARKNRNDSNYAWWLRSASSNYTYSFGNVYVDGYWGNNYAEAARGVSPAFRIG